MLTEKTDKNITAITSSRDALYILKLQTELRDSRAENHLCTVALQELLFLNSHQVRQSICQILSLSALLEQSKGLYKVCSLVANLKLAAISLDVFSKNMTLVMEKQERNRVKKGEPAP
jgi:hypothetical protein